ncbi:MAG: hypothetical protein MI757_07125, partial [Pirellulales bacterium]|nr:hypothetical protein [Pirellulales bacterium]
MLASGLFAFSVLDIAFGGVGAIVGVGAGWWLAGLRKGSTEDESAKQAQLVIDRLKVLATSMAENVDEHTSRVQE